MTTDATVIDVSQDWAIACDVQQRFMDFAAPAVDTISYGARCRQLKAIGGDCYDFLPLQHNRLAFVIGDASGKSLPAALMIANVQSSFRTAAIFAGNEPSSILEAVNRQVHRSSLSNAFATLFYGVFDPSTRRLRYANAGHNPPMVVRRDGSIVWLDAAGLPLGVLPQSKYGEGGLQLFPGEAVIAYTDGVTEAVNGSGEEWGTEGIRKAAIECKAENVGDLVDSIFRSLDAFSGRRQTDDATVVVLLVH